jgi:hypothetical protein
MTSLITGSFLTIHFLLRSTATMFFSHSLSSQVYSNAWAAKKLRGGSGPECKAAGWEERRARLGTFNYVKTMCGTK